MALTIVEATRSVVGGIDTHGEIHVAAALDDIGGLLGTKSFEADPSGYEALLAWLESFGTLTKVGVEGTGSYGAGLARFLSRAGIVVIEIDRPNRQTRRNAGKSDPLDAVEAARATLSGKANGRAKSRDGWVEALRVLLVAKRSARAARVKALVQMRQLTYSAPDQLQARLKGLAIAEFVSAAQGLRPARSRDAMTAATKASLCALAYRVGRSRSGDCRARRHDHPHPRGQRDGSAWGLRRRHRCRGLLAGRRRRQPRTTPLRSRLGAPVRGLAPRGFLGKGHSSSTQPRWRPPGQSGPVAHRDHTAGL